MKMLYLESFIHFFPNKYFIATYPQVHLEDGTFLWAGIWVGEKEERPQLLLLQTTALHWNRRGLDSSTSPCGPMGLGRPDPPWAM